MFMYVFWHLGVGSCLLSTVGILFERAEPPHVEQNRDKVADGTLNEVSSAHWTKTIVYERENEDDIDNA